jgi:hypothetical protein
VITLREYIEHRAAQLGVMIENAMQTVGREAVRQSLGVLEVADS